MVFRDELQMNQQAKIKGRVTAGGMIINRCGVSREHKPLSCSLVLLIKTYSVPLSRSLSPLTACCAPVADSRYTVGRPGDVTLRSHSCYFISAEAQVVCY